MQGALQNICDAIDPQLLLRGSVYALRKVNKLEAFSRIIANWIVRYSNYVSKEERDYAPSTKVRESSYTISCTYTKHKRLNLVFSRRPSFPNTGVGHMEAAPTARNFCLHKVLSL